MGSSMLLGLFDWVTFFFEDLFNLIPKIIYLLYASFISIIDLFQLFFRKLAGLDVYYVDGEAIRGDLVTNFIAGILGIPVPGAENDSIPYDTLSTVFYSFVIFGLIICFLATLIAIVKSHYTYNEQSAKGPLPILATAGKSIINMVAVPIIVVLGLYLSQAILQALDSITSTTSGTIIALYGQSNVDNYLRSSEDARGDETYIYYDMFGYSGGIIYSAVFNDIPDDRQLALVAATSQPFSGSVFKVAGYNANRIRDGSDASYGFTGNDPDGLNLFSEAEDSDELAEMVDTAFASFLHLNDVYDLNYNKNAWVRIESYFTNFTAHGISSFSKFNVGAVWYYYNLWSFNFIVGFGAGIVCVSIFINIIMGMMARFFMCLVLFMVMPPLAGLTPLDGGNAFKGWREQFMKQALMAYGAVAGMNLVLLILPYVNEIDFFNIEIADLFAQTLFVIVGLITIKAAISTLSSLIGAADANETGKGMAGEVRGTLGKATAMTVGAAKIGAKAWGGAAKLGVKAGKGAAKGISGLIEGAKEKSRGGTFRKGFAKGAHNVDYALNTAKSAIVSKASGAKRVGSAFLKGGFKGAGAEIEKGKAENLKHQAERGKFMDSLEGKSYTDKGVISRAMEAGFSEREARQMAKSINRNADGTINADQSRFNLRTRDSKFSNYEAARGRNTDDQSIARYNRSVHRSNRVQQIASHGLAASTFRVLGSAGKAVGRGASAAGRGLGRTITQGMTPPSDKGFSENFANTMKAMSPPGGGKGEVKDTINDTNRDTNEILRRMETMQRDINDIKNNKKP